MAARRPVGDGREAHQHLRALARPRSAGAAGRLPAATFQHPTLAPAGRAADTTVVYLVTRGHGLAESLLPKVAPIDATVNLPPAAAAGQNRRRRSAMKSNPS